MFTRLELESFAECFVACYGTTERHKPHSHRRLHRDQYCHPWAVEQIVVAVDHMVAYLRQKTYCCYCGGHHHRGAARHPNGYSSPAGSKSAIHRKCRNEWTYNGVNFFENGMFRPFNGSPRPNEPYLTLIILPCCRRRHIDLAASVALHIFDRFTA